MPDLKEGDVVYCGCGCNNPAVLTRLADERDEFFANGLVLEKDGNWKKCSFYKQPMALHPDVDRVWALYVAAKLQGKDL